MSQSPQPALERVAALDALRGIAIAMVLLVHCFWVYPLSPLSDALRQVLPLGRLGVDLFFVLSGYLITGILIRTRAAPGYFRRFYIRRALRILPAYYLVYLSLLILLPRLGPPGSVADLSGHAGYYVLHLQNWLFALDPAPTRWVGTTHFWSLAVEEQFYLAWPLVVYLAPPQALRRVCLAVFAASVGCKILLLAAHADDTLIYMSTTTRLDGLAAGAWIATLERAAAARWLRPATAAGALAGVGIVAVVLGVSADYDPRATVLTTTLAPLAFGAAVLAVHARSAAGPILRAPALLWFGRYSYGIYLIHLPLALLLREAVAHHPLFGHVDPNLASLMLGLATVAAAAMLAWLMFRAIELPALNLRHRLAPDPASPTDAEPAGPEISGTRAEERTG